MSLYAKINSENIVENVIICQDSDISTQPGLHIKITEETKNVKINSLYDKTVNKFIDPKPYESWVLNELYIWESPDGFSEKDGFWWDEESLSWKELSIEE